MIVCICEGVSDREVKRVLRQGACDLGSLRRECGAGGDCGSCRPQLRRMLRELKATGRQTPGG
ncbi:MAG: (2Fe-2S)-binding protein [Myxococcales bacterium]|nr:(2Fe-2S)-binding protein [Myxococcales bacterium]